MISFFLILFLCYLVLFLYFSSLKLKPILLYLIFLFIPLFLLEKIMPGFSLLILKKIIYFCVISISLLIINWIFIKNIKNKKNLYLILFFCIFIYLIILNPIYLSSDVHGDEWEYFYTAKSIYYDGDINIYNQLHLDYKKLAYPPKIVKQNNNIIVYSNRQFLYPFMISFGFYLDNFFKFKDLGVFIIQNLIAVFFCLVLYIVAEKIFNTTKFFFIILFGAAPLFTYFFTLYPEVPGGLIILLFLYFILIEKIYISCLIIVLLPFIHTRFVFISFFLFLIFILHFYKEKKKLFNCLFILIFFASIYYLIQNKFYLNKNTLDFFYSSISIKNFPFKFLSRMFSFSNGLFFYAPFLIFAFFKYKKENLILKYCLIIIWCYYLFLSFYYFNDGYFGPRFLIPIYPLLIIRFYNMYINTENKLIKTIFNLLIAYSFINNVILFLSIRLRMYNINILNFIIEKIL